MTFDSSTLLRSTAAEVSSHDDSMPRIVISILIFVLFFNYFANLCRLKRPYSAQRYKILGKGDRGGALSLVMLSVALTLLLELPAVQNFVVDKAAAAVSRRLGTAVRIGHVRITRFTRIEVEDFYVEDFRTTRCSTPGAPGRRAALRVLGRRPGAGRGPHRKCAPLSARDARGRAEHQAGRRPPLAQEEKREGELPAYDRFGPHPRA